MSKETPIDYGGWRGIQKIQPRPYDCGWCGNGVAPDVGWFTEQLGEKSRPLIQVCPFCQKPTLWDADGLRYPAPRSGEHVDHLPKELGALYDEARDCISVNAHTAVVHVCRTIISHVAVTKGAKIKDTDNHHIEYLRDNHHLPAGSEIWVYVIRQKGGDAAHALEVITAEQAGGVLKFTEMLLKVAIEYPEAAKLTGKAVAVPVTSEDIETQPEAGE